MKKLFISQPMNGLTDAQIEAKRAELKSMVELSIGEEVEVIESFFKDAPHDATPLWYLGESIKLLGEADLVAFAVGWQEKRGCRVEHAAAVNYGLNPLYEVEV